MRRQQNSKECQLDGRLDKQAPRSGSRATLGSASRNGLQGRKRGKERLVDAKHQVSIGTWNVRTLWKEGSLEIFVNRMNEWYKWDVIGLAEVRRTGQGIVEYEGHKLMYSGEEKAHQGRVGLLLSKMASRSLIDWSPISSRVISARFNGQGHNITIIQAYAPTSSHSDEDVDEFYKTLQHTIDNAPKRDIKIVIGDFNAQVGDDNITWNGVIGHYGYGSMNERGERLLQFCRLNKLNIMNTWFKHKPSRKWTWRSPGDRTRQMIDYIMIDRRWRSCINNARSYPSAIVPNVVNDHNLVIANFKVRFNVQKHTHTKKVDIERLRIPEVKERYETEITNCFEALGDMIEETNLDDTLDIVNRTIKKTAEEIIGFKIYKREPWISDEILSLADQRRSIKVKTNNNPHDENLKHQYTQLKNVINSKVKECREEWFNRQCHEAEEANRKHDMRSLFQKVKALKKGIKLNDKRGNIRDKDDNLLTKDSDILQRWYEYGASLYNAKIQTDESALEQLWPNCKKDDEEPDLLESEVLAAIAKIKTRKAPGIDGIEGELIKEGGQMIVQMMHKICNKIWDTGVFPTLWTKSLVVTIQKKGDTSKCENYRTISLICHASKIILEIIRNRMKSTIESQMSEEQAGFRPGRGTIEQIFSLRLIAEKYLALQEKELYLIFIDFKKAFDRVWHQGLWRVLHHYGIHPKLINLIENLYKRTQSAIKVGNEVTEWFQQVIGVRQGCILSPDLFNIYLEHIMREALDGSEDIGVRINGRTINNLRFADDIGLMSELLRQAQLLLDNVDQVSTRYGQEISDTKTEWMLVSTKDEQIVKERIEEGLLLRGNKLQYVNSFKYLGTTLTDVGDSAKDIKIRSATALKVMSELDNIWKNKHVKRVTKMRLYRSLIVPIALYGCEAWTLRSAEEKRLLVFEMAALRKILGVHIMDRMRNEDIRKALNQTETIVQQVHARQHQWLGHVLRMDKNRIANTVLHGRVVGTAKRGRPKTMWTTSALARIGFEDSFFNPSNLNPTLWDESTYHCVCPDALQLDTPPSTASGSTYHPLCSASLYLSCTEKIILDGTPYQCDVITKRSETSRTKELIRIFARQSKDNDKVSGIRTLQKRQTRTYTFEAGFNLCTSIFNANCTTAFEGSLPEKSKTIKNGSLSNCALDMMYTGDTSLADVHCETYRAAINQEISRNSTYRAVNPGVVSSFRSVTCKRNCNFHGDCINGSCSCHKSYLGEDCSVSSNSYPDVEDTFNGGLCQRDGEDCCGNKPVYGIHILEGITSQKSEILQRYADGTETVLETVISNVTVKNKYACTINVPCHTRKRRSLDSRNTNPKFVSGIRISLTNDGKNYGTPQTYFMYDSRCQGVVNATNGIEFYLINGTCFIDDECYNDNYQNPTDSCKSCKSLVDPYSWTDGCIRSTNIPTYSTNSLTGIPSYSTDSLTGIVVPVVSSVAGLVMLVVSTIVIIKCCFKKETKVRENYQANIMATSPGNAKFQESALQHNEERIPDSDPEMKRDPIYDNNRHWGDRPGTAKEISLSFFENARPL